MREKTAVTGQHLYGERESPKDKKLCGLKFGLTDKSGREYQVDDGFTGGHDEVSKPKGRRIPTKFVIVKTKKRSSSRCC